MSRNGAYECYRADILVFITDDWQPRRYIRNDTGSQQGYDDLLTEGIIEERSIPTGRFRSRTWMVRRKP